MLKNWLKKIITRAYISYIKGITVQALRLSKNPKEKKEKHPNQVYTSITGLPFNRFLDFYINRDYDALIKKETPKNIADEIQILTLVKAGESIRTQYLDACGSNDNSYYLSIVGGIAKLESKIERVLILVDLLGMGYAESHVNSLKELGIKTQVRERSLNEDLNRVLTEAKKFNLELNKKRQALDEISKESKEPDMEMFYNILSQKDARLSIYDIDTAMYCAIYREAKAKFKAKQKHGSRLN